MKNTNLIAFQNGLLYPLAATIMKSGKAPKEDVSPGMKRRKDGYYYPEFPGHESPRYFIQWRNPSDGLIYLVYYCDWTQYEDYNSWAYSLTYPIIFKATSVDEVSDVIRKGRYGQIVPEVPKEKTDSHYDVPTYNFVNAGLHGNPGAPCTIKTYDPVFGAKEDHYLTPDEDWYCFHNNYPYTRTWRHNNYYYFALNPR